MFSVVAGLLISLTNQSDFHKGLGAVFSLLCFFVMGVLCTEETIEKIRKIHKIFAVLVLVLGILPAVYLPYAIHSVRMTYKDVGFGNLEGMAYRLIFYVIATLMGAAIINLMPKRKMFVSRIGAASILVYAGSTFLAPHAYVLISNALNLAENRILNMVCMVLFCAAIMVICSVPIFLKWYQAVMDFICRLSFKCKNKLKG